MIIIILLLILLSLPNEVGRLIVFALMILLLFFFFFHIFHFFFFFQPKFLTAEISFNTVLIIQKFGGMVDMDVKLCKMVSQFKMSDSKAGPQACPKQLKFSRLFLTSRWRDCSDFLYEIYLFKNIQQSLKFEISNTLADLEECPDPNNF